MPAQRLNRLVAQSASVSRRTADELIRGGRVAVGGETVRDPGRLVDPASEEIRLDGNTIVAAPEQKVYVMLFKPDGVVTTMKDRAGRATVASLVSGLAERVVPVGRLDYHTTGLLLLTNDGDLAYKLTHPRFGVEKTYVAKVAGVPSRGKLDLLRRGVMVGGAVTRPAAVSVVETREGKAWVSIRIAEGRYHQVRRMFKAIGHRVMKLRRVAVGPLQLSGLDPGHWRELTAAEVRRLKAYVEERAASAAARPPAAARGGGAPPKRLSGARGGRGEGGGPDGKARRPAQTDRREDRSK